MIVTVNLSKQRPNSSWEYKHVDIKVYFIKPGVSRGVVRLKKIHTDDNVANKLIKAVPKAKFKHCLNLVEIYII